MFAGKALTVNMRGGQMFIDPRVTQLFVSQHKAHMRELGELFTHRCRSSIQTLYDLGTCS